MTADALSLTPDAAAQCAAACDTYIAGLEQVKLRGENKLRADSFGTLPSGVALGGKFVGLATGTPHSFETVMQQHIEVMVRLRDTFLAAGRNYEETEAQNAARLTTR